jgi:hypothetical protein
MLFRGELSRPIDWLDLLLHGACWAMLLAKAAVAVVRRS